MTYNVFSGTLNPTHSHSLCQVPHGKRHERDTELRSPGRRRRRRRPVARSLPSSARETGDVASVGRTADPQARDTAHVKDHHAAVN